MLVLTRKVGQRLQIGPDIYVTVLDVTGERVRVGVDAPAGLRVLRDELVQQLAEDNRRAATGKAHLSMLLGGLQLPNILA